VYTDLITLVTGGGEYFSIKQLKEGEMQPVDMGLLDNPKCMLRIQDHREDVTKQQAKNINIAFSCIEFEPLRYDGELTVREFNKKLGEEPEILENKQEIIDKLEKQNLAQAETLEKHKHEIQIQTMLDKAFSSPIGNCKKLIDLADNATMFVYGFKEISTKFGTSNIILCSEEQVLADNTVITNYKSNAYLDSHLAYRLERFPALEGNRYGLYTGSPLFKFIKLGTAWTKTGLQYALIDIRYLNLDRANVLEDIFIKPIGINPKECTSIEKLIADKQIKLGDIVKITGARECAKQILIEISVGDACYNTYANHWIKQIFHAQKERGDSIPVLHLAVDVRKKSPNYKREHQFLIDARANAEILATRAKL
jgi:hypothetical protein